MLSNASFAVVDFLFIALFLIRFISELQELKDAYFFPDEDMGDGFSATSVCPRLLQPLTWLQGCVWTTRRVKIDEKAATMFVRHSSLLLAGVKRPKLNKEELVMCLNELGMFLNKFQLEEVIAKNSHDDDDGAWGIDQKTFSQLVADHAIRPYLLR